MNKDIFEGKWKQMRGQVKGWWGRLTDDDLDRAAGKSDQLIGLLQEKYGYSREQAEEEFERRLKEAKAGWNRITHSCLGGPNGWHRTF